MINMFKALLSLRSRSAHAKLYMGMGYVGIFGVPMIWISLFSFTIFTVHFLHHSTSSRFSRIFCVVSNVSNACQECWVQRLKLEPSPSTGRPFAMFAAQRRMRKRAEKSDMGPNARGCFFLLIFKSAHVQADPGNIAKKK